jgi:hypothetical protein
VRCAKTRDLLRVATHDGLQFFLGRQWRPGTFGGLPFCEQSVKQLVGGKTGATSLDDRGVRAGGF